jgi:MraZ protein
MFIGRYQHHLEEKGRLSIPKKFRSQLADGAIISKGLDGCLFLYPKASWEALIAKVGGLPLTQADARGFTRSLAHSAEEIDIDRLGRVLVPEFLRTEAGLNGDCIVAGAVDRVEIWDAKKYTLYTSQINNRLEEIAEKLNISGS